MASFIQSMNIFNKTEVAIFHMQAMLPENGPFSQIYYNEFSRGLNLVKIAKSDIVRTGENEIRMFL